MRMKTLTNDIQEIAAVNVTDKPKHGRRGKHNTAIAVVPEGKPDDQLVAEEVNNMKLVAAKPSMQRV